MNDTNIRLIAFDLDGTLTQHRTPLCPANRAALEALNRRYALLMVGAGSCRRIFTQLNRFPIPILGNYGMQYAEYDPDAGDLVMKEDHTVPCDRAGVEARVTALREKYGFTDFAGDSVEFHASGCVTFPLLGTKAQQADKLAFDPDRSRRRAICADVKQVFSDYRVFVGGSSSFDMAPAPYDKAYALTRYCADRGIDPGEAVYVGDDYGPGGNDEPIWQSGIRFVAVDDYRRFPQLMQPFLAD